MRILMLTSTYPRWSGDAVPPFVANLAEDLVEKGVEVVVLAPHFKDALFAEVMNGVSVVRFKYSWPESLQTLAYGGGVLANLRRRPWTSLEVPAFFAFEEFAARRLLRKERFDLIHSHWLIPQGFVAQRVANAFRMPHVATAHGSDVFGLRSKPLRMAKSWVANRATCVTVNSEATRSKVQELSRRSDGVAKVPNGVRWKGRGPARSVPGELPSDNADPVLLFVGRLVEMKGVEHLLRAFKLMATQYPRMRLLIAGDGPDRVRLEALSVALHVADRVSFRGWVQQADLSDLFEQADIFIGPTTTDRNGSTEAQGIVFLEAMACGIPVIGTSVGGIAEVVRDGETGLVVPPDDPAEIADAAAKLLGNHDLVAHLTTRANDMVGREFSREATTRRMIGVYEKCIDESGKPVSPRDGGTD